MLSSIPGTGALLTFSLRYLDLLTVKEQRQFQPQMEFGGSVGLCDCEPGSSI